MPNASLFSRPFVLAFWAALATWVTPLGHALAAPRIATVSHGAGPGADKAAAIVGHYTRQAYGRDERFELLPVGQVLGNAERDRALRSFSEAEEAAVRARDAYDQLDLDGAETACKFALGRYERFAAYVDDFKKVAETMMLLGAVYILRGDERQGTQSLEQALNVYPQSEPDPRVFNPAMRAQFSSVSAKLATRPGGTLSIATTPGYAEVFVDGQFAGVSPVALENVTEGRHYIRLSRDGYKPAGKVMQVTQKSETADSAAMRAGPRYEEFDNLVDHVAQQLDDNGDAEGRAPALANRRTLGKMLGVDALFVTRVRLDGERVHISAAQVDVKTGRATRRAEHMFAYDSRVQTYEHEVAVMLHEHFGTDPIEVAKLERAAAAAKHAPLADDQAILPHAGGASRCLHGSVSCRALKNGLASTAMALGVVGLVGGTVEYILAANTHKQWQQLAQVAPSQPAVRVRGKNQALLGDVLMAAGAAFTLTGTLTFALWHPTPSAQDVSHAHHASAASVCPAGALRLTVAPLPQGGSVWAALSF